MARRQAIPTLSTRDANAPAGLEFASRLAPDLLVSAFFNQRLGGELVAVPKLGAINIHPSPLPDYKGVDPAFFAALRGEKIRGVSVHRIAAELDAGNVLFQETVPAAPAASVFRTTAALYARGAELITAGLERLVDGDPGQPQAARGNYDSWPSPAQVAEFHHRGGRLVRWSDLCALRRGSLLS